MESKLKLKSRPIYIHAVIATFLINLVHKIVREIPGIMKLNEPAGLIINSILIVLLLVGIILILLRNKLGVFLGILPGTWAILQWIIAHVIKGYSFQNGIWWYPIFPIIQGLLMLYFSFILLINEKKINDFIPKNYDYTPS